MARPPGSRGSETRERILDVALVLFTDQGYDKTSLRDIATHLDITKAALYYYFPRKDDILLELHHRLHTIGSDVLDEMEAAPDGPTRARLWPRLADAVIDYMVENRDLIRLHARNQSALAAVIAAAPPEEHDTETRFKLILASPDIPRRERVRMAAMIGVITEVLAESADAFDDVPPAELAGLVRDAIGDLMAAPPLEDASPATARR